VNLEPAKPLAEKFEALRGRSIDVPPFASVERFRVKRNAPSRAYAYTLRFGVLIQDEDVIWERLERDHLTLATFSDGLDILIANPETNRELMPLLMLGDEYEPHLHLRTSVCFCTVGGVIYPSLVRPVGENVCTTQTDGSKVVIRYGGWHSGWRFLVLSERDLSLAA